MQTIVWPSGLDRPAATALTSCRVRPLPDTIRPCQPAIPDDAADTTDESVEVGEVVELVIIDRAEPAVPVHHVAAWCVAGAASWAALLAVSRVVLNVVVQFV